MLNRRQAIAGIAGIFSLPFLGWSRKENPVIYSVDMGMEHIQTQRWEILTRLVSWFEYMVEQKTGFPVHPNQTMAAFRKAGVTTLSNPSDYYKLYNPNYNRIGLRIRKNRHVEVFYFNKA